MSFLVTARKYRPSSFIEVIAQDHVVATLINSIRLNRIAHAYLFSGPRGVGKTTMARIFAKALNCQNLKNGEPCNTCDTCREISEGRCIDIIEIDGASNNGVEQVRSIRDAVRFLPAREKYKMYIIDEVHMLSNSAFNALLKTLEEPPPHAIFLFATTEVSKLPATVISRCQRYDFRRISTESIVGQLRTICAQEEFTAEDAALFAIAKKGDGSMRDAESIFDQVVAYCGSDLTYQAVRDVLHVVDQDTFFRLTDLIYDKNTRDGFAFAQDVIKSGYDVQDFLSGLEEHLRNLLVIRTTGEAQLIEAPDEIRNRYVADAQKFTEGDILRLLKHTADTLTSIKNSIQPRLKFEIALIAMIKMDSTVEISNLLNSFSDPHAGGFAPSARAASSSPDRGATHARTADGGRSAKNYGIPPSPATDREGAAQSGTGLAPVPGTDATSQPGVPPAPTAPLHPVVTMLMEGLGAELIPSHT